MPRFMERRSINPKLKQSELSCSSSTFKRYRQYINMLSLYRIPPNNTNKRRQKISKKTMLLIHIVSMTLKDIK